MKQFRLFFLTILTCLAGMNISVAQESSPWNQGFGFGFQLNQYQRDFGTGMSVTSPFFARQKIAFRLRGNVMFNEHPLDDETTWSPYSNASLGIVASVGQIGDIRLYSEGGVVGLFPNDKFSNKSSHFGGYGVFGFEFFFNNSGNYFLEVGAVGTGAKADQIASKPLYSNGLLIGTGFRFYLPE